MEEKVKELQEWVEGHKKKSVRHSIYFGLVVSYVLFDIFMRIVS